MTLKTAQDIESILHGTKMLNDDFKPDELVINFPLLKNKITKVMAWFDTHYPVCVNKLIQNGIKAIADYKPDIFIFGGDNQDMQAVNHWEKEKGNQRYFEGRRLKEEYLGFQRDILTPVEKVLPKKCEKIFMLANHEQWVEQHIDKFPELEGFLEVENNLDLKNWNLIKNKFLVKIGKLYIHHGDINGTGKHHASKMVELEEKNILYGHRHSSQEFTKTNGITCESHVAISSPCMGSRAPQYMKKNPNAWLNGFVTIEFYPDNSGFFNIQKIISINNKFLFNGKLY